MNSLNIFSSSGSVLAIMIVTIDNAKNSTLITVNIFFLVFFVFLSL